MELDRKGAFLEPEEVSEATCEAGKGLAALLQWAPLGCDVSLPFDCTAPQSLVLNNVLE